MHRALSIEMIKCQDKGQAGKCYSPVTIDLLLKGVLLTQLKMEFLDYDAQNYATPLEDIEQVVYFSPNTIKYVKV